MTNQSRYKTSLFTSLWYAQFIGQAYGFWLATEAMKHNPIMSGMLATSANSRSRRCPTPICASFWRGLDKARMQVASPWRRHRLEAEAGPIRFT